MIGTQTEYVRNEVYDTNGDQCMQQLVPYQLQLVRIYSST